MGKSSAVRTWSVAAAALAMSAVVAGTAAAAECKTKFATGTWTYTDYVDDPDFEFTNVIICTVEFNTKGQMMNGACSEMPSARKLLMLDGRITIAKNCAITGHLTVIPRRGKKVTGAVTGTLDPKKGLITASVRGNPLFTEARFFQQW